jgi:hypothetical protein
VWAGDPLRNLDGLHCDEFRLRARIVVIFQQHAYNLLKVTLYLIEGFALGVGSRPTWNITDIQSRLVITLND